MRRVELAGLQLDPTSGANLLVLREHDEPHRLLPIVIGGAEATSIAVAATGQRSPRPLTHDLMAALVEQLDGHLDAVEVTDLHDGSFIAQLAVSGPTGERHLDTRPSDGIALAVRLDAPLFVSDHVLAEAGTLPDDVDGDSETIDDEAIETQIEDFRTFLDELDPADFLDSSTEPDDEPEGHQPD